MTTDSLQDRRLSIIRARKGHVAFSTFCSSVSADLSLRIFLPLCFDCDVRPQAGRHALFSLHCRALMLICNVFFFPSMLPLCHVPTRFHQFHVRLCEGGCQRTELTWRRRCSPSLRSSWGPKIWRISATIFAE